MEDLVQIEELRVHFQARQRLFRTATVRAVDGISLTLGRSETVALVGESGSGKTTLGKATLRLVEPTGGRVVFDGADLAELDDRLLREFRQRAQAIFQDPYASINAFMSIYATVEEPLRIHGLGGRREREELVLQALEQVRLSPARELATTYPHTLSGGQRQRVSIARAIVLGPEYVVADEPVSMIDASSRAEILYLLRDLQESRGLTFLYITHDIASARHFSDRIAVMYLGGVVELAASAELVEHPLHPYSQALLEAVPEPDPANRSRVRQAIAGEPPNPAAVPPGCPFHPRCPKAISGTCDTVSPILQQVSAGHWVSCHLYP